MINSKGQKIELAVFDIDGTLASGEGAYPSAVEALKIIHEKGVPICIATGRSLPELPEEIKKAANPEYLIGINGCMICNVKTEEILVNHKIPYESACRIIRIVNKHNSGYCVYDSYRDMTDRESLRNWDRLLKEGITEIWIPEDTVDDLIDYVDNSNGVSKICGFLKDDDAYLAMRKEAEAVEGIIVTQAVHNEIEVIKAGINKGVSLKELCASIEVSPENVVCMGDGENDAEMLAAAGISVAMGNACEKTKSVAKYITDDCDKDGVYNAVMKLFF